MEFSRSGSTAPLIVPFAVHDINGSMIAPEGEQVTVALMEEIERSSRFSVSAGRSLVGSFIRRDMEDALLKEPFSETFSPPRVEEIGRIFDSVSALPVLFDEFETMRSRNDSLYRHALRTAALTVSMTIDLYGADHAALIAYPALTHDLGMLRLSDEQNDGDKAVPGARRLSQGHTVIGFILLSHYLGSCRASNSRVALEHHERPDGSGYPRGIKLEDGIIELLAVADAFDALISPRPFRKSAYDRRSAIDLLWDQALQGIMNPVAVKLLIAYSRREAFDPATLKVSGEAEGWEPNKVNWSDYEQDGHCPLSDRRTYS